MNHPQTTYTETEIRRTKKGAVFYSYKWWEDFGRETGYARSWGCREKQGRGFVWAKPGETFEGAIQRRRAEAA